MYDMQGYAMLGLDSVHCTYRLLPVHESYRDHLLTSPIHRHLLNFAALFKFVCSADREAWPA